MSELVGKSQLPVSRLERSTLLDHVYRQLTDLILDGEIVPGQSITIQSIADAFGVSAMPVREALQRLTAEHVLTVISGRTIGVPPLSADRFYDLLRVRLEIEALAGDWAPHQITKNDLEELEKLITEMDETIQSGNMPAYIRLNRAFHFQIYFTVRAIIPTPESIIRKFSKPLLRKIAGPYAKEFRMICNPPAMFSPCF